MEKQYFAEKILRNETLGYFAAPGRVEVVDVQTPLLNVSWYRVESTMLAQKLTRRWKVFFLIRQFSARAKSIWASWVRKMLRFVHAMPIDAHSRFWIHAYAIRCNVWQQKWVSWLLILSFRFRTDKGVLAKHEKTITGLAKNTITFLRVIDLHSFPSLLVSLANVLCIQGNLRKKWHQNSTFDTFWNMFALLRNTSAKHS